MNSLSTQQTVFARYGDVLTYPDPGLGKALQDLRALLASECPSSAYIVDVFIQFALSNSIDTLEEQYTRAFDLSPIAVPYLSVYLFGAENPQRGRFMAGLVGAYSDAGYGCEGELPDHLAVALRYAAVAPEAEWEEFQRLCLPAPVKHMCHSLKEADNPYQHLLLSLHSFLEHVNTGELTHA